MTSSKRWIVLAVVIGMGGCISSVLWKVYKSPLTNSPLDTAITRWRSEVSPGPSSSVNTLPMYGGVVKTSAMQKSDQNFIDSMVTQFGSREKGSEAVAHRGWDFLAEGDLGTAMKRFNQAWLLDDKNAQAYRGMAMVLRRGEKYVESAALFQKALTCDPKNAQILVDLAHACDALEDYAQACSCAEQASKLDPSLGAAWSEWAYALYGKKDYPGAWEKVRRARELKADIHPEFLRALAKEIPEPVK